MVFVLMRKSNLLLFNIGCCCCRWTMEEVSLLLLNKCGILDVTLDRQLKSRGAIINFRRIGFRSESPIDCLLVDRCLAWVERTRRVGEHLELKLHRGGLSLLLDHERIISVCAIKQLCQLFLLLLADISEGIRGMLCNICLGQPCGAHFSSVVVKSGLKVNIVCGEVLLHQTLAAAVENVELVLLHRLIMMVEAATTSTS